MKYMVTWSIDQDKWLAVLQAWNALTPEQQLAAGDGVTILGRWHDLGSRTGVAIIEAEDTIALQRYMNQWNPHMDMDAAPVLDDAECTEAVQVILQDHAG